MRPCYLHGFLPSLPADREDLEWSCFRRLLGSVHLPKAKATAEVSGFPGLEARNLM